jgi:N-acetylneuraminate lyase
MQKRLSGLVAAAFTPLRADGSLNLAMVGPMVDHLIVRGVSALFVCGSTGEGPLLTVAERRDTAAAYVEAAGRRIPVIVHVGHSSPAEARLLAAHAQQIGADAISAVAPWYFKPASVASLVACLAEIAGGAPQLPFYYYHIPSLTGVAFDMVEVLRRADQVPTMVGIKYTAPSVDELQALLDFEGGRYDILYGRDEMLLSGLCVGARGAIGSTYNFAAPLYRRLIAAFEAGDLVGARQYQAQAVAMIRLLLDGGGLPLFKAIMGWLGFDCGPVRMPLVNVDPAKMAQIRREVEAMGCLQ